MKVEVWKRKKILSVMFAVLLTIGLLTNIEMKAWASEGVPMLDGSYLTHETESIGYSTNITKGVDLQIGYSKIKKLGPEVIYAGGTTLAERIVESVRVSVIIQRAKDAQDDWEFVAAWEKENKDSDAVTANERLEVEGGWYYRAISTHYAGNDVAISNSGGIYITKP